MRNSKAAPLIGGADFIYRHELDGLRGIAVLLVLAAHLGWPPGGGTVGVTLFFVLSGYLITSLLVAERARTGGVSLRAFYERRIRRLAPALTVFLAVMAGLGLATLPQTLIAAAYLANVAHALDLYMGPIRHTWSLAFEEQFYLAWPLLFIHLRDPRWLVATLIGLGLVLPGVWYRFDALAWGCLIGLGVRLPVGRWAVAASVVLLGAATVGEWPLEVSTALVPLASAVVISARLPTTWAPLRWTGRISYALYLWHYPLTYAGLSPLVAVVGSYAVATASWFLVERRFLLRPDQRHPELGPLVRRDHVQCPA